VRILFLTNFYPPHELGGQGRSCQQVVDGLGQRGHDTLVLTSMNGTDNKPVNKGGVSRYLYLEMDLSPLRHSLIFFTRRKERERHNLQTLENAIGQFQPDVIFIWGMWNLSRRLPALAEAQCPGRVVYRFAEYWPTLPSQHEFYWQAPGRTLISRLMKGILGTLALAMLSREERPPTLKFENAICVSAATRNALVEAGVPLTKARIIHTGLDLEQYLNDAPSESPRVTGELNLLYAGRLSADKGLDTAIEAMNHLVHEHGVSDVKLAIAGSGSADYENHLRQSVAQYNLESWVSFLGWIPHEEMPQLMRQFDTLIMPSKWPEPFARIVLEGMVSGLVVVATPNGGTAEIIRDGENGLLFTAEDSQALAQKVVLLASDKTLQRQLRENGRKTVMEGFTLTRMLDSYEYYLQRVADGETLYENGSSSIRDGIASIN
jgi:glycosyltransferase involved in cell wall biosynthesis